MNQRQHNALTKARIKMKRSATLKGALEAFAAGFVQAVFYGLFEYKVIEGERWIAKGIVFMNKMPIDCPHCSQRFSADLPVPQIANSTDYSSVIAIHPEVTCPNSTCRQKFILAINDVRVGWIPVPQERESLLTLAHMRVAGNG